MVKNFREEEEQNVGERGKEEKREREGRTKIRMNDKSDELLAKV
jgi:hypothetical protein